MCRFALIKTSQPAEPQNILTRFSAMAKASRAPDGDIQGDGWGISWRDGDLWQCRTYALPIWEMERSFSKFPKTKFFTIHVRSASFLKDKGNVLYNQPYTNNSLAFVFNGLLKRVSFPKPLVGDIGAQKIWALFKEFVDKYGVYPAFDKTIASLNVHAREVKALNLGVCDGNKFYVYCQYNGNPDYYSLYAHSSSKITVVCSEPLQGFSFYPLEPKIIHILS